MENAVDALKMAFGVFAFVIALSIAFTSFSKAKETADTVLWYADKTNYYDYIDGMLQTEGREVGRDAIIASLYRNQTDTYIIVKLGTTKYIFNYSGKVTEVNTLNGTSTTIDTNEVQNSNYIIDFVNNKLSTNKTYIENITEVTNKGMLGGEYYTGDDGTKIQIVQGDNKIIVTYTQK